ncbi:unnamed protein product [Clonostachys rhizophaga]|uniref:Intracellular protein transport protein USO1 n=1 Tax=Clonostachys rhizophaga TaxID=160324 RepID=A0A9N9YG88_9HYPO|nr:unnamed protein product [Clonostachys rhizophaga]
MFSISTTPAIQSVSETITVLSGRLASSTLLEHRRASILGLRSFAKDYPASVASEALRGLIGSLRKDGEDIDTVKIVLETLLMLFSPNKGSPEASDEIALWLADEFTQRLENITLLLDFLDSGDFYGRLYSLQLLSAILSARPERTEECIFTAPLGISRLVSILDDQREAIRNEAVSLLTYLTLTSVDIQKLVAFENAFERILKIVDAEGSLSEGGRAVEDCLILLANLLRRNPTNQSLFRESGFIKRLSELLASLLQFQSQETDIAEWALAQRNRILYAFLSVLRLFITPGSAATPQNQVAFWKHGLGFNVLQLAFSQEAHSQIKAEALLTSGNMIEKNSELQESFASLMVPSPLKDAKPAEDSQGPEKVYVIDGLLDLTLGLQDPSAFDVRFSACECLKAYFSDHSEVKAHFLGRAMMGYQSDEDETTNVLTMLLNPTAAVNASDPYRLWFAAVIVFHLLYNNPTTKAKALELTEGDHSTGEEVVTSIQTMAAHLITGLRRDDDPRILVGYLMILLGWLYEDMDAVNDFLTEGSNVQGLIQAVLQPNTPGGELVQGLCAMLLGVAYEFSTKDSPIPRATLHSILLSRLERDRYLDRLGNLRGHPIIREFDVTPQKLDATASGLPEVFFDAVFIDFFKDNYSRIARALDRDPSMEISVVSNGVQKGISRELVDSLRNQVEEKDRTLEDLKASLASLEEKLNQERAEHRRTKDNTGAEFSKAKNASETQQRVHEAELRKLQSQVAAKEAENERQSVNWKKQLAIKEADAERLNVNWKKQIAAKEADLQKQLSQARKAAEAETEKLSARWKQQMSAVESDYKNKLSQALKAAETAEAETGKQTAELRQQIKSIESDHQKQLAQARKVAETEVERVHRRSEAESADLKATISRLEVDLLKANKSKTHEMQALRDESAAKIKEHTTRSVEAEKKYQGLEQELKKTQTVVEKLESQLKEAKTQTTEANNAKDATQSELDDLLMVFGDLEDKVNKYKARLQELGETVSDADDDDDEDDEEEEDDEDEDDEEASKSNSKKA